MNERKIQLSCVSLANYKISSIDGLGHLAGTFPQIRELELESNLLNSWSQIFQILSSMENLRLINVR